MSVREFLKDKKGNVTIIIVSVMICFMFPMLAILYDLSQMRIAKQDIRNIQEIAGISCTSVSAGSRSSGAGSSGGAIGAFDANKCRPAVEKAVRANLGFSSTTSSGPNAEQERSFFSEVKRFHNPQSRLRPCGGGSFSGGKNLKVSSPDGGKRVEISVQGMCYYPIFLNSNLLNFKLLKGQWGGRTVPVRDEYVLNVRPTVISGVYKSFD